MCLYVVIHLILKSGSKIYQMNCALKIPVSLHWLQNQCEIYGYRYEKGAIPPTFFLCFFCFIYGDSTYTITHWLKLQSKDLQHGPIPFLSIELF